LVKSSYKRRVRRDPPRINFRDFKDGQNSSDPDLDALVQAVEYARDYMAPVRRNGTTAGEFLPGFAASGQVLRGQARRFVMTQAWEHHASCTCPIGHEDDPMLFSTASCASSARPAGTYELSMRGFSQRFPDIS
jgi:hypothetical protein